MSEISVDDVTTEGSQTARKIKMHLKETKNTVVLISPESYALTGLVRKPWTLITALPLWDKTPCITREAPWYFWKKKLNMALEQGLYESNSYLVHRKNIPAWNWSLRQKRFGALRQGFNKVSNFPIKSLFNEKCHNFVNTSNMAHLISLSW